MRERERNEKVSAPKGAFFSRLEGRGAREDKARHGRAAHTARHARVASPRVICCPVLSPSHHHTHALTMAPPPPADSGAGAHPPLIEPGETLFSAAEIRIVSRFESDVDAAWCVRGVRVPRLSLGRGASPMRAPSPTHRRSSKKINARRLSHLPHLFPPPNRPSSRWGPCRRNC